MTQAPIGPIALTPGEPAGIAPEIAGKAWRELHNDPGSLFFLIGDADQYGKRAKAAGIDTPIKIINAASEAAAVFADALPVMHRPLAVPSKAGTLDQANAAAVIGAIEEAADLCLKGKAAAVVTNPIQKETLYGAGFKHQGHTDFFGHLCRQRGLEAHDVMMLVAGDFRAIPVTVHIPLAEVPKQLTTVEIEVQARIVANALRDFFGVKEPRIAITGLNPHAGENGAMGNEEKTIVIPAIDALRRSGLEVLGPLPADTAFHPEARATYDAILCMYHDQALIPAKTLDFHGGVNVTLGLPFIRTSPDHGTALGIAGTGKANPSSLIAAIKLAANMARRKANQ
jgi:4-hydroxythreonine-4-phosphate dehydrogenase